MRMPITRMAIPVRARQMVLLWKRVGYLGVTSQNPSKLSQNCDGKIGAKL
jgi:hypothetical protein